MNNATQVGIREVMTDTPLPDPLISDYGVVGNLHTAALVSKHGSIDFLSYPRFDSPTVFARILDTDAGGTWSITCEGDDVHTVQHYAPDSAVLITRHMSQAGTVEVCDFMPPSQHVQHCQLIRTVTVLTGELTVRVAFSPRYPYAKQATEVGAQRVTSTTAAAAYDYPVELGSHRTRLLSTHEFSPAVQGGLQLQLKLKRGSSRELKPAATFVFQSADCDLPDTDLGSFGESLLTVTTAYWAQWTQKLTYEGLYSGMVRRSAITLKLCTSAEFGSSVAAITFGLPEEIGGSRNWDYRYSWIRDSAFTMYAMLRLGLTEESTQFIEWIEDRCSELSDAKDLGLMYRVDGTTDLAESELEHLAGYKNSTPVRIGNGAAGQRQLDIYGELIDTVYLYDRYGNEITYEFWKHLRNIVDHVCETWREPDQGIWEVRGAAKNFTMSKVMAWVAIDRGIRIAQHRGFPAPHVKWLKHRDEIYEELYDSYFKEDVGSWTQHKDTTTVDGSLLMMPLVRFVMPYEPNWLSTLKVLEEKLVDGALVFRYAQSDGAEDGVSGGEGYFAMCSMWYIEVLAKCGRVDEARAALDKLSAHANHLGLFSEEIDRDGRLIGNFPQAFTHLGFISAVLAIEEQMDAACASKPTHGG